jgi:hypothetical protein
MGQHQPGSIRSGEVRIRTLLVLAQSAGEDRAESISDVPRCHHHLPAARPRLLQPT